MRWGSDRSSEVRAGRWHCGFTSVTCCLYQDLTSQQPGSPNSCSEIKVFLSTHLPVSPSWTLLVEGQGLRYKHLTVAKSSCESECSWMPKTISSLLFWPFQKFPKGNFCPNVDSPSIPPQCREQLQVDNLNVFYSPAQTRTSHSQLHALQSEAGERHIQPLDNQWWSSTGIWALPTAPLSLHHLCTSGDLPVKLLKFSDSTAAIGLIPNNDECIKTGGLSWFLVQMEHLEPYGFNSW